MAPARSSSHHVYVGSDIVVKLIDADKHSRLDREVELAPYLPLGLAAPFLASGHYRLPTRDLRYACFARVAGKAPGMSMPGVDAATARSLAESAVELLAGMHGWIPTGQVEQMLGESLDHGGFVGQAALFADLDKLAAADRLRIVPGALIDGLVAIAERAPLQAGAAIPVHADCHWANWLACDGSVTALLDFEWARFGEPVDDWFFLVRYSGPHMDAVLDVIARATESSSDDLRAACEVREAAYLASDLRIAIERGGASSQMAVDRLNALEQLVVGQYWWRHAR